MLIPQCSRFISAVFQMGWSMHSQIQYLRFPSDAQIRLGPSWGSLFFLCTASTRYSPATCVFCDLKSLRKAVLLQRSRAAHLRTRAFQTHRKRSGMDSLTTDDRKTPGFIKCVLVFRNRCLVLKGLFFFCFVFSCYLQLWSSHFTPRAWVQELQARPPRGEKKKGSVWCNGKETATVCATFCSLERSSATKHFVWTLVSNPALQTVPFFLSD